MKRTKTLLFMVTVSFVGAGVLMTWIKLAVDWSFATFGPGWESTLSSAIATFGPMLVIALVFAIRADLAERKSEQ